MADKWQQISLKLDAELAQALREMKQGHDESLAEVVIRLLKKVVRQSNPVAREMSGGRSNPKGRTSRGAVGGARKGKPAPAGRMRSGVAAPGKPWAAPAAAAWSGEGDKRGPARAAPAAAWSGEGRKRGPARAAPAAEAAWPAEGRKRGPARAAAPAATAWSAEGAKRGPARKAARGPRRTGGKVGKR